MKIKGLFIGLAGAFTLVGLASCGGEDVESTFDSSKNITCYTRDPESGTRDGFFTGIGFKDAVKNNSVLHNPEEVKSNGNMIAQVKGDEFGIGYISLSSLEESGLKGLLYDGVEATIDNVIDSSYKLTRNFNYIRRADDSETTSGQIVTALLAYMNTREGKLIIQNKGGIVSVTSADKSWNDIKDQYEVTKQDNSNVTIKIAGSTSVSSITKELFPAFSQLCGNFKYEFNQNGSSDAFKRTQGSEKDGNNRCDIAFASRDFNADTEQSAQGTTGRMCIDAIVAVVNTVNPYSDTSRDELKGIYSGTYTKWSDVL